MTGSSPTVRELTSAMAEGDATAIGRFYNTYFDMMFAEACRASRRDEQFSLDIVQNAMMNIIRSIRPMETEVQLVRWTRRLVRNVAYDLLRSEIRRKRREAKSVLRRSGEPVGLDELEAQLKWLAAELKEMDAQESQLLNARYKRGWTLQRIGRELGISASAVDGRLRRLLMRLRRKSWKGGDD